jgi:curved DNA-binding protein CbpA
MDEFIARGECRNMSLQRNYYEVIGVAPTATTDDIKKKYRELARQFHPDVVKDKTLGQKVFTQINQAYRVLADPEKRSQYDTTLLTDKVRSGTGVPAAASSASGTAGTPSRPSQTMASRDGAAAQSASQPLSAQQVTTVARLMTDAEGAMMQNKLGDVKTICDKVLQIDPRNCKAFALMGDALVQMGKPRDATAVYRRAQQIAPSALLQNKISRLEGTAAATAPSTTRPSAGTNGTSTNTSSGEAQRAKPESAGEGKDEKQASGLLSRLLGRK